MKQNDYISFDYKGRRVWVRAFKVGGRFGSQYRIDDSTSNEVRFVRRSSHVVVLQRRFDTWEEAKVAAEEAARAAIDRERS